MIDESDHDILKAFLLREAQQYRWESGIEGKGSTTFQERMFKEITEHETEEKLDFIIICSLTNMGIVSAELRLTAKNYGYGKSMFVMLPPSPRGGLSFSIR